MGAGACGPWRPPPCSWLGAGEAAGEAEGVGVRATCGERDMDGEEGAPPIGLYCWRWSICWRCNNKTFWISCIQTLNVSYILEFMKNVIMVLLIIHPKGLLESDFIKYLFVRIFEVVADLLTCSGYQFWLVRDRGRCIHIHNAYVSIYIYLEKQEYVYKQFSYDGRRCVKIRKYLYF